MKFPKINKINWPVYIKSYLVTFIFLGFAGAINFLTIVDKFKIQYAIMPVIVGLVIGTLIGFLNDVRMQLKHSNEQFHAVVDIAEEFIYYRDINGVYKYVSPSCTRLTGYAADDFYQTPNFMNSIIHKYDLKLWMDHVEHINCNHETEIIDLRIITKSGKTRWIKHVCAAVTDAQGNQLGVRASNLDITEHKAYENKIFDMAFYDPLTHLPNRRLFEQNLQSMIEKSGKTNDIFSIMFLDLDRFKNINDSFGHKLGDKVLVAVTEMLIENCKETCLVSRFGGDEFVLICDDIDTKEKAEKLASKIISNVEQPMIIDNVNIYLSGSIGVAFYPEDGDEMGTLIRNADTALYKTKKDTSNKILFYHTEFGDEASHFISTEQSIHKALEDEEFIPYYQPKVDMRTGKIIGAEALARWQKPGQSLIMPDKFISVAEETSQIIDISHQITDKVLSDMKQWQDMHCEIPISINVSARQFANNAYFSQLLTAVQSYKLKPEILEIEITEQVFLGDLDMAKHKLDEFREAGFKVSLDDFGTGYSSMSYLHELPIDILKIDKSFIDNLAHNKKSLAIMKAIISLSHDLKYTTIAEGIENPEQKDILLDLDCNLAQGYLFHKPMSQETFTQLLKKQFN